MRVIKFDIDTDEIELIPLADLHIGNPFCDRELIKEVCDYIAKTPNCYAILNGDIIDNNIRTSVGSGVYEQTMNPQNQITMATYYLKDIAEKKKIINMTVGNHELRSLKEVGLCPSQLLLANLMKYDETLNQRYCEDGAFTFLTLNVPKREYKVTTTIFNLHGSSSSRKIGAKIQRLQDMSQIITAHIYIQSHTHQVETHRGIYFDVNTNAHTVKEQPCLYVSTNSFLKYGGYGAYGGMPPLSRGIPVIRLKISRYQRKGKDYYNRLLECTIKDHLGE